MSSKIDNINIDSEQKQCIDMTLFCYYCTQRGCSITYNSSSKKMWCNNCQSEWKALQDHTTPIYEECNECNSTKNPVRYNDFFEKILCSDCIDNAIKNEIQSRSEVIDYLYEVRQDRIKYLKYRDSHMI